MRIPFHRAPFGAPAAAAPGYRPDIDGLRAIAVMAVVLHHLMPTVVTGGYVGVDVFFVISGYLITRIILREAEDGTFSFAHFYDRRVRRLFPALFAMLAATLVAGWFILLPSDYLATFRAALGTIFFSSNVVFWKMMVAGYFAFDAKLNPLLHTWSLGVEEQFYLLFPLFLLLCIRFAGRYLVPIILAGAVLTLVASVVLLAKHQVAVFFLSPFRAWELLVGALLALNVVPSIRLRLLREVVAWGGLAAIGMATFWYDPQTSFPGLAALAPVLGAAALLQANGSGETTIGRAMRIRPVVYIGLISYSLYLWHWPLIVLGRFAVGMEEPRWFMPALFIGSLLLASASYHWIERPFRVGGALSPRQPYLVASAGAAALALVCVFGFAGLGYPTRFDAETVALDAARNPVIPFVHCDGRSELCRIGAPGVAPTILVWGDSHALAWVPAIDAVLRQENQAALIAVNSACPPLLGVSVSNDPECSGYNLAIHSGLTVQPTIKTVLMDAYWAHYFNVGQVRLKSDDGVSVGNVRVASMALTRTVRAVEASGKRVIVIGPTPAYSIDVPLAMALARAKGGAWMPVSTIGSVRKENAHFYGALDSAGGQIELLDVATWLCKPRCEAERSGEVVYRDTNHLSERGALTLKSYLVPVFTGTNR